MSDLKFDLFEIVAAHVVVSVVIGEVAAGDFKPDTVTCPESVRRRPQTDSEFSDGIRFEQFLNIQSVAVAGADHAVADLDRGAVARMFVHQAGKEVRVGPSLRFG